MAIQDKFNKPNVIYKITKDIDLGGETLTIPEGCTLDFQGGSFCNGILIGNNTNINANGIIFKNILIQGLNNLKIIYFDKSYNDDNILQSCIDTNTELDFQGRVFNISKPIIINHNIIIRNAILVFLANDSTLAVNVENSAQVTSLKLQNVHIDGKNIAHTGVNLFYSSNAAIEDCTFKNFKDTTSSGSRAILCRRSNNVIIANCDFDNIEATPNGILGDSDGGCRAIAIQNSKAITIQKCHFNNIISEEDGDAIHFNATYYQDDDNYGDIVTSIVENCVFENISRSHIKIQDKGIIVRNNTMLNNNINEEAIIRIYSSDNSVIGNYINYQCAYAISLGSNDDYIMRNIIIKDNMIITPGYSYQAVINSNHPLYNLHVINNSFIMKGKESETASNILYLRNISEEILFSNNVIKGYSRPIHGVVMRPSSKTQLYNRITINNNILKGIIKSKICNFSNSVLGASYSQINLNGNIIDVPTENFLVKAIIWTYDEESVINAITENNNNVSSGVFLYNKMGYSNHRPTLKDNTNFGFIYFDSTLKKPIWWIGTKWVDATGAEV